MKNELIFPKSFEGLYEYESVTVNRRGEIIKRTPGQARYYREELGNGVYLDMVYIAGGPFLMGALGSEQRSYNREGPQHQVTVPDFWIGKYAVTQAQWQAVMGDNPAYFKGPNRPVEKVSWDKCQEFCRKLSEQTGKRYRLPSEAEWEYACRAGTTTPFNCGETITTNLANYDGNYTYAEEGKGKYRQETVEVGSFPPNPWGLYEMHGNVWEWCEDNWHESYQGAPTDGSVWINNHSNSACRNADTRKFYENSLGLRSVKVIRGGSWLYYPEDCRSAFRDCINRDYDSNNRGLRLVRSDSSTVKVIRGGSWYDYPVNCRSANRNGDNRNSSSLGLRLVGC